jgi:hypothetical protein
MNQFAIIGSGQLGTRHLQALALLKKEAEVWIVDTSTTALDLAAKRWKEVGAPEHVSVILINSISQLPPKLSVVVIATNAGVRKMVIEELLSQKQVSYLLIEKFLFNNLVDFDAIQELLNSKNVKAWVNCPRRMFPGYQHLKTSIRSPLEIHVKGTNWGLACNSIHWLDLFHYLSPAKEYSISGKLGPTIESKRPGYIEFNGSLLICDEHQNSLYLSCAEGTTVSMEVTIQEKNGRLIQVDESLQTISHEINTENPFPIWRQSEMTNKVVEELLTTGSCNLTTYTDSSFLHQVLFNFFLKHYNQLNNTPHNKLCPIT